MQKSAIELIAAERVRQIQQEGFTAEHDKVHEHGELSEAALVYAELACIQIRGGTGEEFRECFDEGVPYCEKDWPWTDHETGEYQRLKISDDMVRNFVKAGALIAAEIDRINGTQPDNKREIIWSDRKGSMAEVLVTPERNQVIQGFIEAMFTDGKDPSLMEIVTALNNRGDLTDNEWTATIFALGHFNARQGY